MGPVRLLVTSFGREEPEPLSFRGQVCEATLPSSTAVDRLFDGDPWAVPAVIMSTALRGGLIAAGAYLAGVRGPNVARAAVGGALGIEAFVIGYVGWQKWRERARRDAEAAAAAAEPATP